MHTIGLYLAGADLFFQLGVCDRNLQVNQGEVLCKAQNTSQLCGLLTVFLIERSESGVTNAQVQGAF